MKLKKTTAFLLALFLFCAGLPAQKASAARVGEKLGDVVYTDITAYINEVRIPSYNIDGYVVVTVEDLAGYGFDVRWNGSERTLSVNFNSEKATSPVALPADSGEKPGTVAFSHVYSDIRIYVGGKQIQGYYINGYAYMRLEELSVYGPCIWDSKARTLKLVLPEKTLTFDAFGDNNAKTAKIRVIRQNGTDYYPMKAIMWFIGGSCESIGRYSTGLKAEYGFASVEAYDGGEFGRVFGEGNEIYASPGPILEMLGFEFLESAGHANIKRSEQWDGIYVAASQSSENRSNISRAYKSNYGDSAKTYLYVAKSGELCAMDVLSGEGAKIVIKTFDSAGYKAISSKSIEFELPIFGGFYHGEKYNYIIFGQANKEESLTKETVRIVKYDQDFKKLGSVSIYGRDASIQTPFDAANCAMAEKDNILVVYMSKQQFKISDGLNHQLAMEVIIDTDDMKITNRLNTTSGQGGYYQPNHVSHSFYNGALFDGEARVMLNLGDAYPRSVQIARATGNNGRFVTVTLYKIAGRVGDNYTGVMLGGFEMSSQSYLVAAELSGKGAYSSPEKRDIAVLLVPRSDFKSSAAKLVTLETYVGTDKSQSAPKLVKLDDDRLVVLWQEFDDKNAGSSILKYVYIDGSGNPTSEIKTKNLYALSDCQPVVVGQKIVWFANYGDKKVFFELD